MDNFLAKVIKVQNYNREVVINKGSVDGIRSGYKFLIYKLGEELFDPDTNKSLGVLELVCGRARVKHIQENMTTLVTDEISRKVNTTIIKKTNKLVSTFGGTTEEERNEPEVTYLPFEDVDTNCLAKIINY